jgi:hypothetical protein
MQRVKPPDFANRGLQPQNGEHSHFGAMQHGGF